MSKSLSTSVLAMCWVGLVVFAMAAASEAVELCPGKFPLVTLGQDGFVPFCASQPLHVADDDVRLLVISLPSSNYDAAMAYRNALSASSRTVDGAEGRHLILSPQFLKAGTFASAESWLVFWDVSPFWGSSKALTAGGDETLRLSAYEVLDLLLAYLTQPGRFPGLERIVLVGHSAGGQMVNRFAAAGSFEPPRGVEMLYVAMNASSYLYFDPKRFDGQTFRAPAADVVENCPSYDDYGYGLQSPYSYFRRQGLDAETLRKRYRSRRVVYLAGTADTKRDHGLSVSCAAELQGAHRLERARRYERHLGDTFGASIRERHLLVEVPGVGHSGREMLRSQAALRVLFAPGASAQGQ